MELKRRIIKMAKQKSFINEKAVVKILKKSEVFILKDGCVDYGRQN